MLAPIAIIYMDIVIIKVLTLKRRNIASYGLLSMIDHNSNKKAIISTNEGVFSVGCLRGVTY